MPKVPKIKIGSYLLKIRNPKSKIPNSRWFSQDLIEHGLGVRGRAGAGTVAADVRHGLAFNDFKAVGVTRKFV